MVLVVLGRCEEAGEGLGCGGGFICTSFTSGIKGSRLGRLRPEKVMLAVAKQRLRGLV